MSTAPQPQPNGVLIVDDDPAVLNLLRSALERKHFRPTTCLTGAEAMQTLQAGSYDVVLLDLTLPDVNGLELIQTMRQVAPQARIVVITADTTSESLLRAIRDHAYEYLRKPFDIQEVVEVVQQAASAENEPDIEVQSAKPHWLEMSIPCTRHAVDRIERFIHQLIPSMPDDVACQITQAFRELLLNAVEWGGGLDPARRVHICCVRTSRMLLYRIADPGPGFRFEQLNHSHSVNEDAFATVQVREDMGLRPGGFGIKLVQAIADELIYNEKQNEVILIKYLDPPVKA